jgi:hypothetical protein
MSVPSIELSAGSEQNAFAGMMAELIRSNLADHPEKQHDFAAMSGRVALVAEDAESVVTLHFRRVELRVHSGMLGVPDLLVRGSSASLIDLSRIPPLPRARFLPDLRSSVVRDLARAIYDRSLRIHGLLAHPLLAMRLSHVLSIY